MRDFDKKSIGPYIYSCSDLIAAGGIGFAIGTLIGLTVCVALLH